MKTSLTFAPLIRVSTERQEKRGESLHTQRAQLQQAIENMNGKVYEWYAGQEHATPDQERTILDKLMRDAEQKKFDAVVVADISRWSRDNGRSKQDLDTLKRHGIRFFVREREFDLFDPLSSFMVGMNVEVSEFFANEMFSKSYTNSIGKAKKGIPSKGKLPYGRTFDKKTGEWGIDADKQEKIKGAIDRYLAGGSILAIAPSIGLGTTQLSYIFNRSLGTEWSIDFASKKLNVREKVQFTIPALVDEKTIKKVKNRMASNRTYTHGQAGNKYLLGRMIFCEKCGTALTGAKYRHHLHYRHSHVRGCKQSWSVRADGIETAVFDDLYKTFGDAVKATEAMQSAIPDPFKRKALEGQLKRCQKDLAKNEQQRNIIIDALVDGTLSKAEVSDKMQLYRQTEASLLKEAEQVEAQLVAIPSKEQIGRKAQLMRRLAHDYLKSTAHLREMTFDDKREMLQNLFAGKTDDGKRLGVYITRDDEHMRHNYIVRGNCGEFIGYLSIKQSTVGLDQ